MSVATKFFFRYVLLLLLLFAVKCSFKNSNPLDPDGENYVPPFFTLKSDNGYIDDGDTVHRTTVRLFCIGNKKECLFQTKLNNEDTTGWQSDGEIHLRSLSDGTNSVVVNCKYKGGIQIVSKTINFHVIADGYVPKFDSMNDSTINPDTLQLVTLSVRVTGPGPISFQWFKDNEIINGQNQNILIIEHFSDEYAGVYYCIAANEFDTIRGPRLTVAFGTSFTITYDGNGNTSGVVPVDAINYAPGKTITVKGNVGNLVKTGHSFGGWSTQLDGGGIVYYPGAEIKNVTSNVTLFAIWSKTRTYSIIYADNGSTSGYPPNDPYRYDSGTVVIVKGNTGGLKRENYTFVGWNTAADNNGVDYPSGKPLTIQNENVILYAKWTQGQVCRIIYDGNGNTSGTVPVDSNTYGIGAKIVTKTNYGKLAKNGFSFIGWNTSEDGSGLSYGVNFELQLIDTVTILYARWTKSDIFTVVYDGNGNTSGNVPTDENVYEKDALAILKTNESGLARTGYRFTGWCTDKDGNGKIFAPSDTMPILGNTVLFACWNQIVTCNVVYNGNGNTSGSVPVDTMQHETGSSAQVLQNSGGLKKDDYVFAGWNTESDGKGKHLYPGNFLTIDSSVILYAFWTQSTTFSVEYDGNGSTSGVPPVDSNWYVSGASATVRLNYGNLAKTGYSFTGWTTKADGSGTLYTTEETFTVTSDVTLYAKWSVKRTFNVTYNGNANTSGTVPIDANSYETGNIALVKGNTGNLSRDGYNFTGWNQNADGSGTDYAPNSEMKIDTSSVILYAVWTKISTETYKITYNGNGNTGGSAPLDNVLYKKGAKATVLSNSGILVKAGYSFAGWSTELSGTAGTISMPGDLLTITGNTTLYAVWTKQSLFKVIYVSNGATSGTVPFDNNSYLPGVSVTVKGNSGNLEKTGSAFAGWNTQSDGKGETFTENTHFEKNAKDDTLYAKWSENPTYTIKYFSNNATSGSVPIDANLYEAGVTVTVKNNVGNLVRNEYSFNGWNTRSDGTGDAYAGGSTLKMPSENLSLYADWKLIPTYTVTYNGNGNTSGVVPIDNFKYKVNQEVTVKDNSGLLRKDNLNFSGWNTRADGSGTSYGAGAKFNMGNSNVTLYAIWTSSPTYTVSYNANGATNGNIPTDNSRYKQGDYVRVMDNTGGLARSGYIFSGWNTSSAGSGNSYLPGAQFTMGSANVILWAVWTPFFTVNYTGNGNTYGSSPVDTTKYKQWQVAKILGKNTLQKDGFTFSNWNTQYNAKGKFYKQNDTLIINNSSIQLHAAWQATIVFNGQGGTNPASVSLFHPDTLLPSFPADPTRNKYVFAGWYTAANGGTPFTASTKVTGNATVYARWTANRFTLTYNGNNSTGGTIPAGGTYDYNTIVSAASNTLTRDGFMFTGWNTAANGGGTSYSEGADITMDANITLYAQWSQLATYTIVYNGNGNTGGTVPVNNNAYMTGDTIHISGNTGLLVKTDSTFTGWSRVAGNGKIYKSGDTLIVGSSNSILYARWTKIVPLTITTFNFASPAAMGIINNTEKTIEVTVPFGTAVTNLVPAITHTGVSVSPASGVAHNFTNEATYTVSGEDGTEESYQVTVRIAPNPAKEITAFSFTNPAAAGVINNTEKTIIVTVPYGTDRSELIATFTTTGASVRIGSTSQASGVTPNDFTNPVTYTVYAADGSTQEYVVTVTVLSASNNANLSALVVSKGTLTPAFAATTSAYTVNVDHSVSSIIVSGTTADQYAAISSNNNVEQSLVFGTNIITLSVTAQNGTTTKDYVLTVNRAPVPVSFSGLSANGDPGTTTTTELTLFFSTDPATLSADNITVSGAEIGELTGTGTTRTLRLTSINVENGQGVTVTISNPANYVITPASHTVMVFKAPTPVSFSNLIANGSSGTATTTELTLTFDADPATLTVEDITVDGAAKGALTSTGAVRVLTLTSIDVTNGDTVKITIKNPQGFAISPLSLTVPVYVQSE